MRIFILYIFVAICLVSCDKQSSSKQPSTSRTENSTINSTIIQTNSTNSPPAKSGMTEEMWKEATASDKLKNGPKNDKKF